MFTGADGLSSIAPCVLGGFAPGHVGAGPSLWSRPFPGEVERVQFNLLPVGWVGDWHESPVAQWVVPLSGRWFVEMQDGACVEMGPGDIHWGQDLGTIETEWGRGHRSGTLGDQPCVLLAIRFKAPIGEGRCPF